MMMRSRLLHNPRRCEPSSHGETPCIIPMKLAHRFPRADDIVHDEDPFNIGYKESLRTNLADDREWIRARIPMSPCLYVDARKTSQESRESFGVLRSVAWIDDECPLLFKKSFLKDLIEGFCERFGIAHLYSCSAAL